MKQVAAILLSLLLFFNWFGYRLVSDFLQHQSDSRLEAKLDRDDYDESQLVEIRVPLDLPYQVDWQGYERFNGEIEIEGVHYKYVKRKVENSELVLLCLPNSDKQMIQSARDEFFKLVNDLQQSSTDKKPASGNALSIKTLLSDYRQEKNEWSLPELSLSLPHFSTKNELFHSDNYSSTPEQPPETPAAI